MLTSNVRPALAGISIYLFILQHFKLIVLSLQFYLFNHVHAQSDDLTNSPCVVVTKLNASHDYYLCVRSHFPLQSASRMDSADTMPALQGSVCRAAVARCEKICTIGHNMRPTECDLDIKYLLLNHKFVSRNVAHCMMHSIITIHVHYILY